MYIRGPHSIPFFWRRVLQPASEFPWSLTRGNQRENLEELQAGEQPDEPVAKQMWLLLHQGFSILKLMQVLAQLCNMWRHHAQARQTISAPSK